MQKIYLLRFFISVVLAVIGFFTLFNPSNAMFAVVLISGIAAVFWGAITIIQYFNQRKNGVKPSVALVLSLVFLIAGIFLLIYCIPASKVFIPVVIGLWAFATGIFAVINAVNFYRQRKYFIFSVIAAVFSFLTGIIMWGLSSYQGGFTAPSGGVFLLFFGIITAVEISIARRRLRTV